MSEGMDRAFTRMMEAIGALTEQVGALTQRVDYMAQIQQQASQAPVPAPPAPIVNIPSVTTSLMGSGIEKPAKFRADQSSTDATATAARNFLAAFTIWASNQPHLTTMGADGSVIKKEANWIASFLSFMDGTAGAWAVPFLEDRANGQAIFADAHGRESWEVCKNAFQNRFSVVSSQRVAKEALARCIQGKRTVPAYAAEFRQHADRSGYQGEVLRDMYKRGLSDAVLGALVHRSDTVDSLEQLIAVTLDIDRRLADYRRDKKGQVEHSFPASATGPASQEPVPMEIDAARSGSTRSRMDFLKSMKGKCFRCGSREHQSTACPNATEEKLCGYCKRPKHFESVCQDKFMGLERNRGLAPPKPRAPQEQRHVRAVQQDEEAQRKAASLDALAIKMKELDQQRQEIEKLMAGFR